MIRTSSLPLPSSWRWMVTSRDFAMGAGPCRCGRRRRWRDALSEGPSNGPSKLARCVFSIGMDRVTACALRGAHGSVAPVAFSDGETQCLKVRSDGVRNGPSLRSQAATGPCGFTLAEAVVTRPAFTPFLRSQVATGRLWFYPSREQRRPSTSTPPSRPPASR